MSVIFSECELKNKLVVQRIVEFCDIGHYWQL